MRILMTIPILLGVTIICFALVKLAPGDPVQNLLSPTSSAEDAARVRAAYGLDKPVILQYFIWLAKVCVGNLGMSISDNVPVAGEVLHAFVNTLVIALISVLIAFFQVSALERLQVRGYADHRFRAAAAWHHDPRDPLVHVRNAEPGFHLDSARQRTKRGAGDPPCRA